MLRAIFLTSLLISCWLWMQIVHEFGHVIGAWCTGGVVRRVVLHPLQISRTDVEGSSQPLVVMWAGPILGSAFPLLVWMIVAALRSPLAFLFRFFAGVCLVANGFYLAAGSFDGVGDCGDLLRHGSPRWTLWLFGLATIPAGFLLWHRQASPFGFGAHPQAISPQAAWSTTVFAACTILAELAWSNVL